MSDFTFPKTDKEDARRPSFQFYPHDWMSDHQLQQCSIGARGFWLEMMCLMHQSTPYGYIQMCDESENSAPKTLKQPAIAACLYDFLVPAGNGYTVSGLAKFSRISNEECKRYLKELSQAGVFSITEDNKIYSRRMIRDEEMRRKLSDIGKLGGTATAKKHFPNSAGAREIVDKSDDTLKQPALAASLGSILNPPIEQRKKQPTHLTSSSSSTATLTNTPLPPVVSNSPDSPKHGFSAFWESWPRHHRKHNRLKCEKFWNSNKLDAIAETVLASLKNWKRSDQWSKDAGQYIPAPLVWLHQQRWETPLDGPANVEDDVAAAMAAIEGM